jgi:RNA polymerase sigma-70 factor (ECF subfamily)
MTDEDILKSLRAGDQQALAVLYERDHDKFVDDLRKQYALDKTQASDLFIESLIKLEKHVREGGFAKVYDGGIPGWLYTVGKNEYLMQAKKDAKAQQLLKIPGPEEWEEEDHFAEEEQKILMPKVRAALDKLGDPCRKLLTLFYLEGLSYDRILLVMHNYSNTDVLKKEKYRCLNRLRAIIFR